MHPRLWTMSGISALLMAGTACAADFTFNVPVAIHNMPADVKSFFVTVEIDDGTWDQVHNSGFHRVGYGSGPTVMLQNGEYTGVYTLAVDTYITGRHPQDAVFYEIDIVYQVAPGKSHGDCGTYNASADLPFDLTKPCLGRYIGRLSDSATSGTSSPTPPVGPQRAVPRIPVVPRH